MITVQISRGGHRVHRKQGVHNNYDIDLFQRLIKAGSELSGCNDLSNNSLRVIADHIRSCAFMLLTA